MSQDLKHDLGLAAVPFAPLSALRASGARVIDLRSPSEFADDHIPGAVNVPLFDDQERAMVGLLYKQFSPEAAFAEGRAVVADKVVGLVADIARAAGWTAEGTAGATTASKLRQRVLQMTEQGIGRMDVELTAVPVTELPDAPVALHCWRGGLRSRSVIALVRALGLTRAVGVEHGYRAWRHGVMGALAAWPGVRRVIVLRGMTGVGKTLVLREIERLRPGSTLDLEGLAGHRSSLLGMVGLAPVSQKTFESALSERLAAGFVGDTLIVEGESRKVGDVVLPAPLWDALRHGTNVWLTAPIPRRVEVLIEDYLARPEALPVLRQQLAAVEARMTKRPIAGADLGQDGALDLVGMLDRGEARALVRLLLEHYYDPLYGNSEAGKVYALELDASEPLAAARGILAFADASD
ncbi:MAG: tRNA 2-selenouridine(34) synthase MnmH [Planctomycetota bacterium]